VWFTHLLIVTSAGREGGTRNTMPHPVVAAL
jgi:hypothetical protein